MINRIYTFLGLALKAGKLVSGEESCEKAIKMNKVKLIVVADDASENTKKNFSDMCSYRSIEIKYFGEKELLGRYIGKNIRAVVAILDNGFAKRVIELIDIDKLQNGGARIG